MIERDSQLRELLDIDDKMSLSERLVDMDQVVELTTLSRRTLLNLEARGGSPNAYRLRKGARHGI